VFRVKEAISGKAYVGVPGNDEVKDALKTVRREAKGVYR
jgi:hypothetical protein